jgi:uncharacterized protein (TIGR02453 family)
MTAFTGIPFAALDFYEDLEADNSKSWWTAHKAVYEEQVRAPLLALLAVLEPEFGAAKVFRPYRDVRFAKDKTPFKTHQGAVLQEGGRAGLYLHVDAEGLFVAAGRWELSSQEVSRYRDLVAADYQGGRLVDILAALARKRLITGEPELQRLPSGYPKDHPRAALLRRKSLTVSRHFGSPDWLPTPRAAGEVAKTWRAARPLCDWLDQLAG